MKNQGAKRKWYCVALLGINLYLILRCAACNLLLQSDIGSYTFKYKSTEISSSLVIDAYYAYGQGKPTLYDTSSLFIRVYRNVQEKVSYAYFYRGIIIAFIIVLVWALLGNLLELKNDTYKGLLLLCDSVTALCFFYFAYEFKNICSFDISPAGIAIFLLPIVEIIVQNKLYPQEPNSSKKEETAEPNNQ